MLLTLLLACGPGPAADPAPISVAQLRDAVDVGRIEQLIALAAVPRTPGSEGWQTVQDLCVDQLDQAGFSVSLQRFGAGGVNVIGRLDGEGPGVVLGAHYDHISGCNGADDNASGVAGVLEAARVLASASGSWPLTVACWDQEERGLLGSAAWLADQPELAPLVYVNFDMIGVASDVPGSQQIVPELELVASEQLAAVHDNDDRADFIALLADSGASEVVSALQAQAQAIELPVLELVLDPVLLASPLAADLRRSDHASFWDAGLSAVFLSDTANFRYDGYHCLGGADDPERLDVDFAARVTAATTGAIAGLLDPSR